MIQDIYPSKLDNSYKDCKPSKNDYVLVFDSEGKVYVGEKEGEMILCTFSDVEKSDTVYLFSVDEKKYFLLRNHVKDIKKFQKEGFSYYTIREIRDKFSGLSMVDVFAVFTAYHLWKWYVDNKFCGKCGETLTIDSKERALRCPKCGNVIYPRINPAVIVGVIKGDSLLLTRYRRGYAHNALVAGFTEIGETLEETVAREVMEETGIKVKNIRYYKSQPWGMAQDILVGFFCEADGDGEIHMDENELRYAEWVKREDIELQPNNLSLTNEMMKVFKEGRYGYTED